MCQYAVCWWIVQGWKKLKYVKIANLCPLAFGVRYFYVINIIYNERLLVTTNFTKEWQRIELRMCWIVVAIVIANI